MKFGRTLTRDFVDALNGLYNVAGRSWWKGLVEDEEIFIAVRGNSLNAYFQGCSIAQITFEKGEVCASTHYKYLLRSIDKPYIRAAAGKFVYPSEWNNLGSIFVRDLSEISALQKAAKIYSRRSEREFVAKAVTRIGNVLDVEVAFSVPPQGDDDSPTTPRIDFAAVQPTSNGLELVMYETKLFENAELRSRGEQVPVLGQIAQYEEVISDHNETIRQSYLELARIIVALNGLSTPRKRWAQAILDNERGFSLSKKPVLVIGKFSKDQKFGKDWKPHKAKLERQLTASRIILASDEKRLAEQIAREPQ